MPVRLILLALLAAFTFTGGYQVAARNYRLQIAERELELAKQYGAKLIEAQTEARATEQALAKHAADIERKKNATLSTITAVHAAELERLRNRPAVRAADRPGEAASPAATGVGCTGAGLAGPDAGFLAGYAADAGRLQAELARCTAAYDKAVESTVLQR